MIDRIRRGFGQAMSVVGIVGIIYLMLATVIDVISRSFTGRSLVGVIETSEVALVFAVFLVLGYAQMRSDHFAMSLVTDRIPAEASRVVQVVALCVASLVALLIFAGLLLRAIDSAAVGEYRFGSVPVAIWPARLAAAFGALYFAIETAFTCRDLWTGKLSVSSTDPKDLPEVQEAVSATRSDSEETRKEQS